MPTVPLEREQAQRPPVQQELLPVLPTVVVVVAVPLEPEAVLLVAAVAVVEPVAASAAAAAAEVAPSAEVGQPLDPVPAAGVAYLEGSLKKVAAASSGHRWVAAFGRASCSCRVGPSVVVEG